MRKIFKSFISLTLVLMFVAFSAIPALAADYKSETDFKVQADRLNSLGLFIGTNNGYELERIPTRAEAAVMLVRLLGKENEAKAGTYVHPFKDVPQWVDKYVGYLYENGLTKGTTAKTFEPDEVCSAQMYSAFVLRALGYTEDGGDYIYNEAEGFTYQLGLRLMSFNDAFLRDDMVALSYSALFNKIKDSEDTIFDLLVSQSSVNEEAAVELQELYDSYVEYANAIEASYYDVSTDMVNNTSMTLSIGFDDINIVQEDRTKTIVEGNEISLNSILKTKVDDIPETQTETYYADGWMYVKDGEEKYKQRLELTIDDYIFGQQVSVMPFYLINSISKTTNENRVEYSISYNSEIYESVYDYLLYEANEIIDISYVDRAPFSEFITLNSSGKLLDYQCGLYFGAIDKNDENARYVLTVLNHLTVYNSGDEVEALPVIENPDEYIDISEY